MPITRNKPSQINFLTSRRCYDSIIGIDPDTEASGVAVLDTTTKQVGLHTLPLGELIRFFTTITDKSRSVVIVEAGWLNASNWHANRTHNHRVAAKIGSHTGANHQIGKDIVAIIRAQGFEVIEQRPLRKCWRGKDSKITHDEISQIARNGGYAFPTRSNQETRDAALIAWNESGMAVVVGR